MNVSLTPELEKFVQDKVKSGMYTSASEVIRESLRLLHEHDDLHAQKIRQLNQDIEQGLQQLAEGQRIPSQESYQRLKKKIERKSKNK